MKISLVSSKTCTTFLFSNGFKQVKATKVQEGEVVYWKIKGSKIRYNNPVAARNAAGWKGK